jgi:vitamin B12 transporter
VNTASRIRLNPILFALALAPLAALPAGAEDELAAQLAEEMVVTASRTEERPIDVPVSTQVITNDQIEMSGAADVSDLIAKYVPAHLHKYSGMDSAIGLRGFRTDTLGMDLNGSVLILIDGHRVGTGNAAKLNLDRIERVEVIKGPSSALYGSSAMGGVVNLITKKGDGKLGGSVGAEVGSFESYKGLVSAGGEVNEKFRFYAATSAEGSDDYSDPTFGQVFNSGETKKNVGGNFIYTFNDNHELRLGGNYADLNGENPAWDGYATYSSYDQSTSQDSDKSTGYTDLEYNGDYLGGTLHWKGMAYFLWDKNQWNWGVVDPDSDQTKYVDETLGTDQQLTWKMNAWNTLLLGFTLESLERKTSAYANYLPETPSSPGLDFDNQAVFVQDSLDLLNNRVNLIAAARYDRFEVGTHQGETGAFTDFDEKSEDYTHLSPKIGVGVKFFDELLRVRANLGEGFKSPTADQLAADYVHAGSRFVGNPNLEPETSRTYDLGFDIFRDPLTLKAGYFHTDYQDRIERYYSDALGAYTYDNLTGDAKIAGYEIGVEWAAGKTLHLPFAASLWSNMTFNAVKEDDDGADLKYISDYELKSGLDLNYQGLGTQLSHTLAGPQTIDNWDTYPSSVEEKSSFDYWDLTLRYRFAERWEVKGSVLNLFDQEVEWVRGYLMPERNYRVGLTYRF